jgi:hypothetical protein
MAGMPVVFPILTLHLLQPELFQGSHGIGSELLVGLVPPQGSVRQGIRLRFLGARRDRTARSAVTLPKVR